MLFHSNLVPQGSNDYSSFLREAWWHTGLSSPSKSEGPRFQTQKRLNFYWIRNITGYLSVVYFDQLLGAARTQKLVETFFQPFFNLFVPLYHCLFNKWLVYYQRVEDEKIIFKLSGLVKSMTKMGIGCLRMTNVAIFDVNNLKGLLVKYEKYGTRSII